MNKFKYHSIELVCAIVLTFAGVAGQSFKCAFTVCINCEVRSNNYNLSSQLIFAATNVWEI